MIKHSLASVKQELHGALTGPEFKATLQALAIDHGATVDPPEVVYTAERTTLDAFPAGEIIGAASVPKYDTHAQIYDHRISVIWTLIGDDEETLARAVELYVMATRLTLHDAYLDLQATGPMVCGREDYAMLGRAKGLAQPLVKAGALELTVPTVA